MTILAGLILSFFSGENKTDYGFWFVNVGAGFSARKRDVEDAVPYDHAGSAVVDMQAAGASPRPTGDIAINQKW